MRVDATVINKTMHLKITAVVCVEFLCDKHLFVGSTHYSTIPVSIEEIQDLYLDKGTMNGYK